MITPFGCSGRTKKAAEPLTLRQREIASGVRSAKRHAALHSRAFVEQFHPGDRVVYHGLSGRAAEDRYATVIARDDKRYLEKWGVPSSTCLPVIEDGGDVNGYYANVERLIPLVECPECGGEFSPGTDYICIECRKERDATSTPSHKES